MSLKLTRFNHWSNENS